MEVFSLEDEEYGGLFLTQESKENEDYLMEKKVGEDELFLGVEPCDFTSPVTSVRQKYTPVCSDVSDNEFEENWQKPG